MIVDDRLQELGITLPDAPTPAGVYVPAIQTGNLLFIAGQVPSLDGKLLATGKCGDTVSIEEGALLARQCTLNGLAIAKAHLGRLDRITQTIRVAGYVASAPGFTDHPKVVNGASQLLLDVLGDRGKHARIAVGVAELPSGVPVEVEFCFEVSG